jgi:predicted GNAT family acetyltransferase
MASDEERTKLFAATVEEEGQIVAAALRSDFPKMVLAAEGSDHHMIELARLVYPQMPGLPCVLGTEGRVDVFAADWGRLCGVSGRSGMPERIHVLDAVKPYRVVAGKIRAAKEQDFDLLLNWSRAFEAEAIPEAAMSDETLGQLVGRGLQRGTYWLWEDSAPVSMAAAQESGEGVARVGPVYTPPVFRRSGYGGALTAAVSQTTLDCGCTACCLFTDLTNPTSNHIYAEIGYVAKADIREFWFDAR